MTLSIRPLTLREANAYVALHHRHNKPVVGHRFSIGVSDSGGVLHGVATNRSPEADIPIPVAGYSGKIWGLTKEELKS